MNDMFAAMLDHTLLTCCVPLWLATFCQWAISYGLAESEGTFDLTAEIVPVIVDVLGHGIAISAYSTTSA